MKSRTRGVNCRKKQYIVLKGDNYRSPERVEIRTINEKPLWHLFKDFINSLDDGHEFSRKELLEGIYVPKAAEALRQLETSVDHYRLYSCHIGFIDHIGRGRYIKRHSIPDEMTSTFLKKHAYNDAEWKDWFIPKRDKLRRACEACKQ